MKHLAVGVIGHVDHGKTSVVRALTGMDTDRLPEEKARGMSIVPGYAWIECGDGAVDLVDVPGHEDFLRGMIAGAAGIDAALLVVDAREGPRAQTVEHIAIAAALGVVKGLVALNKIDLLAPHERDSCATALRGALRSTFLADAAIIPVSAATGEGIGTLRESIGALAADVAGAAPGPFYMGIDRAFVAPGQGTVVTGTLRGGALERGAEVEILPSGLLAHARQLQVHGRNVPRAMPGQRVGVNLRGVAIADASRGCVVAAPGTREAASTFQAGLKLLDERPIAPSETLCLFMGTDSVPARVRRARGGGPSTVLDVELRCARPLSGAPGDRFVLRSDARHRTVAAGEVIALGPRRLRLDESLLERLQSELLAHLDAFHAAQPAREGASVAWWRSQLAEPHRGRAFDEAVARLHAGGRIERVRDRVRRSGFDPLRDLPPHARECAQELERRFRDAGAAPPEVSEVIGGDPSRESVCRLLVARGRLVRVGSHAGAPVIVHRDALDEARRRLARAFPPPGTFTVSQARELLGSTRKYVVPLLEFLDGARFTQRHGDARRILPGNPARDA